MDPPEESEKLAPDEAQSYADQICDIVANMDPESFPGSLNTNLVGWGDEGNPLPPIQETELLPPASSVLSFFTFQTSDFNVATRSLWSKDLGPSTT